MSGQSLRDLLLYRQRYLLGGGLLIVLTLALVVWQLGGIPPGFSGEEKQSALISANLDFETQSFVNLPYHLLQKATLLAFGPDAWGIRLPSVLLALGLVATTYFLLKSWFRGNMAVIGTVLLATSVYFLMRARLGTPEILYYVWPPLLLLTASMVNISGNAWRLWLLLFTVVAALSLYTPYMIFFLGLFLIVVATSRAGRLLMAEIDGSAIALSFLTLLVLLAPLGYGIYQNPQSVFDYIGILEAPTTAFLLERLSQIGYLMVGYGAEPGAFYPVLGIPAIILGLYGLYHAVRFIGRIRDAAMVLWLMVALALFVSTPDAPSALLFIPFMLLVILGVRSFINIWYGLFPRNPYARTAALLPIALLLLVVVGFNYQRYFYGLPRAENVRATYDSDIMLLQRQLGREPRVNRLTIVVPSEQEQFIGLLQNHYNLVRVAAPDAPEIDFNGDIIIAEPVFDTLPDEAKQTLAERQVRLLVDDRTGENALRFRSY